MAKGPTNRIPTPPREPAEDMQDDNDTMGEGENNLHYHHHRRPCRSTLRSSRRRVTTIASWQTSHGAEGPGTRLADEPPSRVLCQHFITNFQGTYPRPGEEVDQHTVSGGMEPEHTVTTMDKGACITSSGHLALVTSPTICNVKVGHILIDGGGGLNLLSPKAFVTIKALGMHLKPSLPIIGVTPSQVWPLGQISLPVTFTGPANSRTERVDFDVANLSPSYNAVLSRLALSHLEIPHMNL
uniref:Uncharacterized protein n=1 Tax=Oryza brachyantha TaxID=4533 RepID=J3M591_ORYBR